MVYWVLQWLLMLLTLSTNVTTTAKVNETARLSATFTPGASLTTDNLKSQTIGFITLSGYKGSPLVRDLSFSDVGGVAKSLSLNGISGNDTLYVNAIYDNAMLGIVKHSKVPLRIMTFLGFGFSFLSLCLSDSVPGPESFRGDTL